MLLSLAASIDGPMPILATFHCTVYYLLFVSELSNSFHLENKFSLSLIIFTCQLLQQQHKFILQCKSTKNRNTFCGTWYLHIASSTMNELFLQLWPDALRMHGVAIFPLPVYLTSPSSFSSRISLKARKFRRFAYI